MFPKLKSILRFFLGRSRVRPRWYIQIQLSLFFTKKIKVGFGPITSGEDDLAVRKWRIDPIVDQINRTSKTYRAGVFLDLNQIDSFDLVVLVKRFHLHTIDKIRSFQNKRWIYDIVDNPNDEVQYRFYFLHHPEFLRLIDRFILSSPVHRKFFHGRSLLIEHPIINRGYKTDYNDSSEIKILAQGYYENLKNLKSIERLLPPISLQLGKKVRLYYHTEAQVTETEFVRSVKWDVRSAFSFMNQCDIAIHIRNTHILHQYTKPSTKPIAFMAAGLPLICKPGPADLLVIQNQITGYFAFTLNDWVDRIGKLAASARLRRQIGTAARKSVEDRFSISTITNKYLNLFDDVCFPTRS